MKKMKTVVLVTLLALSLATWVQAGKGGSKPGNGGGGKTSSSYPPVIFTIHSYDLFPDQDSVSPDYYDELDGGLFDPGVQAEMAGSGNPLLRLNQPANREAFVDLSGCITDAETAALLASEGDYQGGIVPIRGISPYGVSGVEGNFVGMMSSGDSAETLLGIGLVPPPSDGRGWSVRFDPAFESSNLATVTREADGSWLVNCADGCRAAIVRPPLKGNGPKVVVGTCPDLAIEFTVTCENGVDSNGQCNP